MQDQGSVSTRERRRFPSMWQSPPRTLHLEKHEVHVWVTSLEQCNNSIAAHFDTLEGSERERAARFHFERDRNRFIVARGTIRSLLGEYLGIQPSQIRFDYNSYGKPSLAGGDQANQGIRFNVSHSGDSGLFALCRNREVGVDVERIRPDFGTEEIAARFFSVVEAGALHALPPDQRAEAFFNCWTRKEAYIKARGEGLSFPLERFDVAHAPGQEPRLLCVRGEPHEEARWQMRDLAVGEGYKAAVVAEGNDWEMKCYYTG